MIEKSPRSGSSVEVTFRVPPIEGAVELYLCGDFNDWHASDMPFRQEPDGSWVTRIVLEAGKSYRFRYFDNQGRWHNEREADAYVPNTFGTEDSVVDLAAPLRNTGAEPGEQGRGGGGTRSGQGGPRREGPSRAGGASRRPRSRPVPGSRGQDDAMGPGSPGGSGRHTPRSGEQGRGGASGRGRHRRRK